MNTDLERLQMAQKEFLKQAETVVYNVLDWLKVLLVNLAVKMGKHQFSWHKAIIFLQKPLVEE